MNKKFDIVVKQIIQKGGQEATRLGHDYVGTEHLLLGILSERESLPVQTLEALLVDIIDLKKRVEKSTPKSSSFPPVENLFIGDKSTNTAVQRVLKATFAEAKMMNNSEEVYPEHLMLALLKQPEASTTKLLEEYDVDYDTFKKELEYVIAEQDLSQPVPATKPKESDDYDEERQPYQSGPKRQEKSRTPVLDHFGRDLTRLAEEGKLDPVFGREREIENLSQILSRRKKNNPILVGESGVGKTAIVEGLTLYLGKKKNNHPLKHLRIVTLDVANIMSGTKKDGQIEERIEAILIEIEKSQNVLLFVDEINVILNPGGSKVTPERLNLLKLALASGRVQCIAACRPSEYQQFVGTDITLERRFHKIMVDPPSEETTVNILKKIKSKYEDFHRVNFPDDVIEACVKLSNHYIIDRFFPDKAIDVLDELGASTYIKNSFVPPHIETLEKETEEIRERKNHAVKNQSYEEAANLRDAESKMVRQLEFAKAQWEEENMDVRIPVEEDDIYEMFALKTGLTKEALQNFEPINKDANQKEGESEGSNRYKEKVDEFDLDNKASIKIKGIPNHLKTSLQQYILFFKEYLEKVKDKDIYFEVSKVEEGLRIDINPAEIDDFDELNDWFNEYMDYIRKKNDNFTVKFEKEIEKTEAEIIMVELKNQVRFLQSQLDVIQLQVRSLTNEKDIVSKLTLNVSNQHKYLIELGYGDLESFKSELKKLLGEGKINPVLEKLMKYFSNVPDCKYDASDEIILLKSRLSVLEFKATAGALSFDHENKEKREIVLSLIELVNKL